MTTCTIYICGLNPDTDQCARSFFDGRALRFLHGADRPAGQRPKGNFQKLRECPADVNGAEGVR